MARKYLPLSGSHPRGFQPLRHTDQLLLQRDFRAFEHPDLDAIFEKLQETLVPEERAKIWQEIGDYCFEMVCSIPMFAIAPDIAANPNYVKDYVYPGFINSFYTHMEYVETVPQ